MPFTPLPPGHVLFGPFTADLTSGRLFRGTVDLGLRPQAFRALRVLLYHQGDAVHYEQMIAEAWEGVIVSRHTVDVTVAELRKALGEYAGWVVSRAKRGHSLQIPASDGLVRTGWHFWERRTRDGFERAIECFQRAAQDCPADARAFEGMSASHLMLATFGMRPPREEYPRFLAAHERAVALGGLRPELRCNRAYGLHLFERRYGEAEAELLTSLEEDPMLTSSYVRLAMLHGARGRFEAALHVLSRGYEVDPLLPMLPTMEIAVRVWGRDIVQAVAVGAKTVAMHPHLQVGRAIYAQALELCGRQDDALEQYRIAILTSPDLPWMRALEGACLAKLDRVAEAVTVLRDLEQRREKEYVDAFFMAVLREALGQRDQAFAELQRAAAENSGWLYTLDVDPKMDTFRDDPRFRHLRSTLEPPASSKARAS